jgi:transposase-like protein
MLIFETVHCPYCGEANEIQIDPSAGRSQSYVEDCQVCCRPWQVQVRVDRSGGAQVTLHSEDDTGSDD